MAREQAGLYLRLESLASCLDYIRATPYQNHVRVLPNIPDETKENRLRDSSKIIPD